MLQATQPALSRLHSKVEPASLAVKLNAALLVLASAAGFAGRAERGVHLGGRAVVERQQPGR